MANTRKPRIVASLGAAAITAGSMLFAIAAATAAEWSDTSIGYRYGTKFAEPYGSTAITKNIFDLQHVSGYKYGTNFFNVDMLLSDGADPASCPGFVCTGKAQEVYVVYRNTVDFGKVTGKDLKFGIVRGLGLTFGFDYNTKTDAGYSSKKRMPLLGPTVMFDVPGFLNVSLLALWESNAPCTTMPPAAVGFPASGCVSRYTYDTHAMLTAAWGIPIGSSPFSFEGFANYIGSKGTNEFGGPTSPETNIDAQIMLDVGRVVGGPKGTFKVGFEYQYWKNKFGNPTTALISATTAGPGATAKTSMIRAEYHF